VCTHEILMYLMSLCETLRLCPCAHEFITYLIPIFIGFVAWWMNR